MSYRCERLPVRRRVTNGQRAAVCALVMAGVAYGYACNIAGISPEIMQEYLGEDWRKKIQPRRRWTDDQLAELEGYWRDPKMKVATIASLFGMTPEALAKLRKEKGLLPRRAMPNPKSVRSQPKPTKNWYRKLQGELGTKRAREITGLGQDEARTGVVTA